MQDLEHLKSLKKGLTVISRHCHHPSPSPFLPYHEFWHFSHVTSDALLIRAAAHCRRGHLEQPVLISLCHFSFMCDKKKTTFAYASLFPAVN